MADAYGALTFSESKDCNLDRQALVETLNRLEWDNSGGRWVYYEDDDSICFSDYRSQYPTVFPQKETMISCYCEESDSTSQKLPSEMTAKDWECVVDVEMEPCTLEELRDSLVCHIKRGWIEIACSANEKCRYVIFETLRIHADGAAERMFATSGPCVDIRTHHETVEAAVVATESGDI